MSVRLLQGRYALQPTPRTGGMSTVYRASDLLSEGRIVAIKFLEGAKLTKPGILAEVYARETQALKELTHPNIVSLLDEGTDAETGAKYLVLDWVDDDLSTFLSKRPIKSWDDFEDVIGFPVLEALAHAHSRDVAHRDVKPHNCLVEKTGRIRLTDFGIAKIKRELTVGLTLNEFVSRPFSPPEIDEGSYTYTRDVFGFAVLALSVVSQVPVNDYQDISAAIRSLSVPASIRAALERATSFNPAARQATASILLTELRNARAARDRVNAKGLRCDVILGEQGIRNARRSLAMESDADIEAFLVRDLNEGVGIQPFVMDRGKPTERIEPDTYDVLGSAMQYRMVVASNGYQLVIDQARSVDFTLLERWKKVAWQPSLHFVFGRVADADAGRKLLEFLERGTQEHIAAVKASQQDRRDERLFSGWSNVLDAKREAEQQRQKPLRYIRARVDGSRIEFKLGETCDDDELIGQPRRIGGEDNQRIAGEIEHIDGDRLYLALSRRVAAESVPDAGELVFDTSASERALDRQRTALEAVRLGQAVRASLRQLLIDPSQTTIPKPVANISFFTPNLDEAKKDAVRAALGAPDFLVVEGPPGTGKTTFIAELVLQELARHPNSRILITSQTHVALDNAVGRIVDSSKSTRVVRIARPDDPRVGEESQNCTIDRQLGSWRQDVKRDSESFLLRLAQLHDIAFDRVKGGVLLQRLRNEIVAIDQARERVQDAQRQLEALKVRGPGRGGRVSAVDVEAVEVEIELRREALDIAKRRKDEIVREIRLAKVIAVDPERLSQEKIRDMIVALLPTGEIGERIAALIRVQAEWLEAFGRGSEFNRPLVERSQVVASTCLGLSSIRGTDELEFDLCILDEASKATATESIVPIQRSRRWVLVGDAKQLAPYEDELARRNDLLEAFDIENPELRETLFDRLLRGLPTECRRVLTVQHRMVRPIGRLISHCFYDGKLESRRDECDPLLMKVANRAVVWLTTSKLSDCGEARVGSSYVNNREAVTIRDFLLDLCDAVRPTRARYKVCVLSGYTAQLAALRRLIKAEPELQNGRLEISLCTVDAVQGRESDIAIYSVTRSNRPGKMGFLRESRRVNVALSRGRELLLIVGDHSFVEGTPSDHALKTVFRYIQRNGADCEHQEVSL